MSAICLLASVSASLFSFISIDTFTENDYRITIERLHVLAQKHGVNLTHIESRPSRSSRGDYDFIVDLLTTDRTNYDAALSDVQSLCKSLTTLAREVGDSTDGTSY